MPKADMKSHLENSGRLFNRYSNSPAAMDQVTSHKNLPKSRVLTMAAAVELWAMELAVSKFQTDSLTLTGLASHWPVKRTENLEEIGSLHKGQRRDLTLSVPFLRVWPVMHMTVKVTRRIRLGKDERRTLQTEHSDNARTSAIN